MKLYKVFFKNDQNNWDNLNKGFLCLSDYKKIEYNKRKEFNNLFHQASIIKNGEPCVNTFNEEEIENSLFFFLDLFDAINYVNYFSNKLESNNNIVLEYKILELELPDELVLKYLGIGNYEFTKDFIYNLSFEVAIPFDKLEKSANCILLENNIIKLNDVTIHDGKSQTIIDIINYLSFNPNYKDSEYFKTIETLLNILGFNIIFGTLYKKTLSSKEEHLNIYQYKILFLSKLFPKIQEVIEQNRNKIKDYYIKK